MSVPVTMLPAVEMLYQSSLPSLFVHSSKWNVLRSTSLVCFRSSYTSHEYHSNNIGLSCYGFQINSPKGPEGKLMDYVSLLKLLLFTAAAVTVCL
jgi:hypothetical protein